MERKTVNDGQNVGGKTKKLVGIALLMAIVIVLQLLSSMLSSFGFFTISLVLIPIVVGAALYGAGAGAFLGGVFGVVVAIACVNGMDKGGNILWTVNPFLTAITCVGKGALAGLAAGAVYRLVSKKNQWVGIVLSAIVCPVVNTGTFVLALVLFFKETLNAWAGGTDVAYYVITGLVGVNFLLEVLVNVVLCPAVARIVKIGKKA